MYQLDVKSNLPSTMVIFKKIKQPPGFIVKRQEKKVLKLKKAIYGLLQAPRAWYSKVDSDFLSQGFRRSCSEPTFSIKCQSTSEILILYVDDLIVTGFQLLYFIFQARYDEQLSDERFGVDE